MTKQENEYVRTLNLSPEMEALVKNPTYTDLWGVVNNWTNIDEGWYPMRRYKYLSRIQDINIQRKNIKRFTESGYKGAFHLHFLQNPHFKSWIVKQVYSFIRYLRVQYSVLLLVEYP